MPKKNIYVKDIYGPKKKNNRRLIISLCFTGILVTLIVVLAYFGQNVGSFSVKLGDDLTSRQIFISEKDDFSWYDSRLEGPTSNTAEPVSYNHVKGYEQSCKKPESEKINPETGKKEPVIDGSIVSYTFYLKNMGRETVNVLQQCYINGKTNGIEKYTWLKYFEDDDEGTIYQGGEAPNKDLYNYFDGDRDILANYYPQTIESYDLENNIAYEKRIYDLRPGDVKKFTLMIWIDRLDPDLLRVDEVEGTIQFEIYFSLFRRW